MQQRLAQPLQNVHVVHNRPAREHGSVTLAGALGIGRWAHNEPAPVIAIQVLHALQRVCDGGPPTQQQRGHDGARWQHINIYTDKKTIECTQQLLPPMPRGTGADLNDLLNN